MKLFNNIRPAFLLALITSIVSVFLICMFPTNFWIIIPTTIVWILSMGVYARAYYFDLYSIPVEKKPLVASKGTSDANKLGEYPLTKAESHSKTDQKIVIEGKVFENVEGRLLTYTLPKEFSEEYDRLLTNDEIDMLDKHYFGFYHSIGVDKNGHIQISPRANSIAVHYVTPEILANYMLDDTLNDEFSDLVDQE